MKITMLQTLYNFVGRLSKREKIIFYGAITFVSLTLLDRLIISPIYSKVKSLNKEIQDRTTIIKQNLHIVAQKDRISSEITKYAPLLASAKSEEEETTSFLQEIEGLANEAGVYLVDMKPASLKDGGSSKRFLINLNCESQMEQLTDFMYKIENSINLLTVEKYQIGPKSKDSSVVKCSMSIVKMIVLSNSLEIGQSQGADGGAKHDGM